MVDADKKIVDGTEHRNALLRMRQAGIREIITSLGPDGFCMVGPGRLEIVDGSLYLSFCANVGTYQTRIIALGFDIDIPLTEEEIKFSKTEVKPEPTEEVLEKSPDPVVPAVSPASQLQEGQADGHPSVRTED